MLNYPNFKININGIDTISAGGEVTIKGNIIDDFGNKVNSFSGNLYVNIFESARYLGRARCSCRGKKPREQEKPLGMGVVNRFLNTSFCALSRRSRVS